MTETFSRWRTEMNFFVFSYHRTVVNDVQLIFSWIINPFTIFNQFATFENRANDQF